MFTAPVSIAAIFLNRKYGRCPGQGAKETFCGVIVLKICATSSLKSDCKATAICALLAAAVITASVLITPNTVTTLNGDVNNAPTVIVDAGHGGVDGGAVAADGTEEKDLNLQISQTLCCLLTLAGYEVVPVRTEDISVHSESAKTIRQKKISDLHNRLALTESTPHCILVSIHQNIYVGGTAKGTQVFFSGNNPQSALLAQAIQTAVQQLLQPKNTRQIKQAGSNIYLLYQAKVPAVMAECGFLSDKEELAKLKTEEYRSQMAHAVFSGIVQYMTDSAAEAEESSASS